MSRTTMADIEQGATYSVITQRAEDTLTLPGRDGLHAPSTVEMEFWPIRLDYKRAKERGTHHGLFKAGNRDWRHIGLTSMAMVGTLFIAGDGHDATLIVTRCGKNLKTSLYIH